MYWIYWILYIGVSHSILSTSTFPLAPARAVTIVLCAPETAGPWSAVTIRIISMNFVQ